MEVDVSSSSKITRLIGYDALSVLIELRLLHELHTLGLAVGDSGCVRCRFVGQWRPTQARERDITRFTGQRRPAQAREGGFGLGGRGVAELLPQHPTRQTAQLVAEEA